MASDCSVKKEDLLKYDRYSFFLSMKKFAKKIEKGSDSGRAYTALLDIINKAEETVDKEGYKAAKELVQNAMHLDGKEHEGGGCSHLRDRILGPYQSLDALSFINVIRNKASLRIEGKAILTEEEVQADQLRASKNYHALVKHYLEEFRKDTRNINRGALLGAGDLC